MGKKTGNLARFNIVKKDDYTCFKETLANGILWRVTLYSMEFRLKTRNEIDIDLTSRQSVAKEAPIVNTVLKVELL